MYKFFGRDDMFKKTIPCIYSMIFILALLFMPAANAFASEKAEKRLTKEEASILMKQLSPEIEVISVQPAPVEGLWEIVAKARGQVNILYMDSSRQNVFLGSIVNLQTKLDLTRLRLDDIKKIDVSEIPLDDALVMGDEGAKHKVIIFDDPD
jgi:thiol:disulfide interchange protein DsbC